MSLLLLGVVAAVFIIVVIAELLWRTKVLQGELSRKLVHILVGIFAATWGFFLDDKQIYLLAGSMFSIVVLSRAFGVFQSIHSVSRKTWGELFFPSGIALVAWLTDSPWVFMAALLHVGIADGLAAVIGSKYIKLHGYKVFKQQKTIVGTLTFFNASLFITLATLVLAPELQGHALVVFLVPLAATLAENLGRYGADDVLVPLVVTLLLSNL